MANKMVYEKKISTKIVGVLDKDGDDYIISIEDKDNVQVYRLDEILNGMLGTIIALSNELNV